VRLGAEKSVEAAMGWWKNASPTIKWRAVLTLAVCVLSVLLVASPKPWGVLSGGGSEPKLGELVRAYSWWAMAANALLLIVLAGICPWWAGSKSGASTEKVSNPSIPGWFWPLVGLAMLISAGFAVQRMNHSLWDDEEYALRRAVLGTYKEGKDGQPALSRLKWQDTLYAYKKPTNHIFYSVLSRLSLDATAPGGRRTSLADLEWIYRLPAWIAGVGSVGALAWMLAEFGFARAGLLAAFLLAFHPWHLRYASEARGYSIVLLLIPLVLLVCRRAVLSGRWHYWAIYGLLHFLLLYTWPGTLYTLLVLNLGMVLLFVFRVIPWASSGRWFVSLALAAVVVTQLMLPLMPQIGAYMTASGQHPTNIHHGFMTNAFAYLLLGAPWKQNGDGMYPVIFPMVMTNHHLALSGAVVALILTGLGFLVFSKRSPLNLLAGATLVISPALALGHALIRNLPIFEWYLIYGILGVASFVAVGADRLGSWISGTRPLQHFSLVPGILLVLVYAVLSHPVRSWHLEHPLQQIRESVLATRPSLDPLDPQHEKVITAGFIASPHVYDARVVMAKSADTFFDLLRRADAGGATLYVNTGQPWAVEREYPAQWAAINDPALFYSPVLFKGLHPGLDRFVAMYRPGSVANYRTPEYLPSPASSEGPGD